MVALCHLVAPPLDPLLRKAFRWRVSGARLGRRSGGTRVTRQVHQRGKERQRRRFAYAGEDGAFGGAHALCNNLFSVARRAKRTTVAAAAYIRESLCIKRRFLFFHAR